MTYKTHASTTGVTTFDTTGISDQVIIIFTWVLVSGLCQAIDIFGLVTNIINIICFVKQGFLEPINISLLGLAVADVGCLVTQIFINTFSTLAVSRDDLPFDAVDVLYITAVIPHLTFCRVNNWITVIITVERCLCVTVPLKVKYIVTPKRMWLLISFVYLFFLLGGTPVFAVNRLDETFSLTNNRTILGLISTADKDVVESITFTINGFLLSSVAFITIIICTIVLVVKMKRRTNWLKTYTTAKQTNTSLRDQKVAKMVIMISVLFIACFVPLAVIMLAVAFEPNLNVGGRLLKIGKLFGNIVLLMESINSSANIFIYYCMSNKYRETFDVILCKKQL